MHNLVDEYNKVKICPTEVFKAIAHETSQKNYTFEAASGVINISKNRYGDVLANDSHRYRCDSIEYINADVTNNTHRKYILSQGPIKHHMSDFLSMVMTTSPTIICLAQHVENSRIKFDLYFNDNCELVFFFNEGHYRVSVMTKTEIPGIIIRTLKISKYVNNVNIATRMINHIHYINWPDNGVPTSKSEFLRLFNQIPTDGTLLVHCSAGIGRTGVFVVLNEIFEDIKKGISPCVISKIIYLRKFRYGLVQNYKQLLFCYETIFSKYSINI